jgi:DNA-binding transcriptional MerR regulator
MPPKPRLQKRLYYKIGEACKALDIQPYVLRYWETEFPALSPNKSRSGQRVYSEKELAVIRRIKELLYEEGYTIAGAKKKLETELASGSLSLDDGDEDNGREAPEPAAEEPPPPPAAAPRAERSRKAALQPAPAEAPEAVAAAPHSPATPEPVPAAAPEPPLQQPLLLDTRGTEQVESMRKGIQQALDEARGILAVLAKSPQQ